MQYYIYAHLNMKHPNKKRLKLLAVSELLLFILLFFGILFLIYARLNP